MSTRAEAEAARDVLITMFGLSGGPGGTEGVYGVGVGLCTGDGYDVVVNVAEDAHIDFLTAVNGVPVRVRPSGPPVAYSSAVDRADTH